MTDRLLDAEESAVLALCHPVKNAASGSLLPRGGSAFLNELDANTTQWSHSPGEVTELHWCGQIRGPDFAAVGYRCAQRRQDAPTGATARSLPLRKSIADTLAAYCA